MKKLIRVLWAIEKDLRVIASNTKVQKTTYLDPVTDKPFKNKD